MVLIFVVLYESQPKSNQITRYNVLDNFKFLSCATLCYKSEVTLKKISYKITQKIQKVFHHNLNQWQNCLKQDQKNYMTASFSQPKMTTKVGFKYQDFIEAQFVAKMIFLSLSNIWPNKKILYRAENVNYHFQLCLI